MATLATLAYGSTMEWSDDGGATFTNIPECKGIVIPGISPDYLEVTSLDSSDGFREYIAGLKDPGEISFTANKTAALMALVQQYAVAGTLIRFRLTMTEQSNQTSADTWEFDGFVSLSSGSTEVGAAVEMEVSIRLSGKPTYTAGA